MAKRVALARAELAVARVVWRLGEARVRDVVDALAAAAGPGERRRPDFSTVQTYLRRLKAKGYLRTRTEGRAHVYLPAVSPGRVLREVVSDFVNRAFGGASLPLVQHLIADDPNLSDDDIDQLQATLERLKRQRRKSS